MAIKTIQLGVRVASGGGSDSGIIAYNPNYLDAIPRLNWEKHGESRSVLDWGAKADGTTDDAGAINAAIETLSVLGGGKITLPRGVYAISSSIMMKDNVSLIGEDSHPRFGEANVGGTRGKMASRIICHEDFPVNGIMIDARYTINTRLSNLDIIGNSASGLETQVDATSTGIAYGTAQAADENFYARHELHNCSVALNRIGIDAKQAAYFWWTFNNIGANWEYAVRFENYAGNDGTYIGNYINTTNWWLTDVADPLADVTTGVGIYFGYGCAYQSWIGGKIEYCATGIVFGKGCWALRFENISFDANSKWHVRIIGNNAADDLQPVGLNFVGCRFIGGSSTAFQNGLGVGAGQTGYDGHVFIDAESSTFLPPVIALSFAACEFKSAQIGGLYEVDPNYPKFPSRNIITSRVVDSGPGKPDLKLILTGCDCEHGAVASGTCDITDDAVTKISGDDFSADMVGKTFWEEYFNRFIVGSFTDSSHLTITSAVGSPLSNKPWYVDVNRIDIDPSAFTVYSDIYISNCLGLVSQLRKGADDNEAAFELYSNGGKVVGVAKNGAVEIRNTASAYQVSVTRDQAGVLYVGRYQSSGYTGAVIDFASPDALNAPTLGSIRVGGNEWIQIKNTGQIGFGVGSPTARAHFVAGQTGAGLASIKINPGALLTTSEDGALEYDGVSLWFTTGVTRRRIAPIGGQLGLQILVKGTGTSAQTLELYDIDETNAFSNVTITAVPSNSHTVIVNTTTYTFVTMLSGANQVLIAPTKEECLFNLYCAINDISPWEGYLYGVGTVAHTTCEALPQAGAVMKIQFRTPGVSGNGTDVGGTAPITWSADPMSGGAAATFPHKYIRVAGGAFVIRNDAFSNDIFSVSDDGVAKFYGNNSAPPTALFSSIGTSAIRFARSPTEESNSGSIQHGLSSALAIIGLGNTGSNRIIRLYDHVGIGSAPPTTGSGNLAVAGWIGVGTALITAGKIFEVVGGTARFAAGVQVEGTLYMPSLTASTLLGLDSGNNVVSAAVLPLGVSSGGTGATTAGGALSNLGAAAASHGHNVGDVTGGASGTAVVLKSGGGTHTLVFINGWLSSFS